LIQILIVDDHAIVRRGLKQILADESDIRVSETADPREALGLIRGHEWDLLVIDLDLPGRSGLELLQDVKRERPSLPVLILSVHPQEQFAVRTLKAGAAGFLSKDTAPEDLVKAIRKILRGGKYISESVAEQLVSGLHRQYEGAPHESLSDREFEILRLFGAGKTATKIAEMLSISVATVRTYRARILDKMGLKTTAELVRYAVQHRLVS
jgi:two-component system, NarL family, invasion response regulator UvrY